ncbi:MAG: hypothetical protein HRT92_11170 [Piscirickettsiaceae bacterium]|nr:hypothetical protein [Piscirickettsiaceae bacterium]
MKRLSNLKYLAFYFLIGLFLSACGEQDTTTKAPPKTKEVLTLSDSNIKSFTHNFVKEYLNTLDDLINAYETAKKNDTGYKFVNYRNHTWTPNFKERKDYYEALLRKNNAFVKKAGIKPLFEKFSSMLYIGIYLKRGIIDDDQETLEKALNLIVNDRKIVKSFSK